MKIEKGASKNIELIGYTDLDGHPSLKLSMQVVDGRYYLYFAHFWSPGWTIADVTDPANPTTIKTIPGPENTETCQVQVADGIMITNLEKPIVVPGRPDTGLPFEEGIYIWDVKDPLNPKRLGHFKTGATGTHRNHWEGGRYVHLAATARGFTGQIYRIVDIIDPTHPVEVGRWWLPEQWTVGGATLTKRVALHGPAYPEGDRAYLGYGGGGIVILDISDMTLPKLVSRLEVHPPLGSWLACHTVLPLSKRKLALASSEAIAEGGQTTEALNYAAILDISDEKNPRMISLLPLPEPPPGAPYKNFCEKGGRFGPHNFHHPQRQPHLEDRDDRVYLTYFNAGLRIYDISDPYLPREIAYYIPPDPTKRIGPMPVKKLVTQSEDVLVDRRGYIYVTDKNHGLHVLRCTV
jgi:hypothetical protein